MEEQDRDAPAAAPLVQDDFSDAALDAEPHLSHRALYRLGWVLVAILLLILLTVLPPLLNVNRYQHRVAQAISASIARPVHFDGIHLHLLPLPGLTIQNFVVEEDPAFGTEPALRASTVEARLRLSSLWRRRVEVSHIRLQAPSINLVRLADGRWNLQGVIAQAGYLQNAPTPQGSAGPAPRFPYIEADEARINVKSGNTKLPWSLLDSRLALWLPDQNEWRLRLRGRPLRTDTDVSDVGELELEGSLGRGTGSTNRSGGVMDQPLAVSARWASTPLGETAKLLLGRDTGFRGAASAELELRGTPAHMQISTELHLHNLRRAEFVPRLPMSLDAHCEAGAMGVIHAVRNLRCAIPTAQSAGLFDGVFRSREEQVTAASDVLLLEADIPDIAAPQGATGTLDLQSAQPEYFLNWLRVFSSRIPEAVTTTGSVTLHADWNAAATPHTWTLDALCRCTLSPAYPAATSEARPSPTPASTPAPTPAPTLSKTAPAPVSAQTPAEQPGTANPPWSMHLAHTPTGAGSGQIPTHLLTVEVGRLVAEGPVAPTAPGRVDPLTEIHAEISAGGSIVQYASPRLARYAASLLPPLGDNLPAPGAVSNTPSLDAVRAPMQSERSWGQGQVWTASAPAPSAPGPRRRHR